MYVYPAAFGINIQCSSTDALILLGEPPVDQAYWILRRPAVEKIVSFISMFLFNFFLFYRNKWDILLELIKIALERRILQWSLWILLTIPWIIVDMYMRERKRERKRERDREREREKERETEREEKERGRERELQLYSSIQETMWRDPYATNFRRPINHTYNHVKVQYRYTRPRRSLRVRWCMTFACCNFSFIRRSRTKKRKEILYSFCFWPSCLYIDRWHCRYFSSGLCWTPIGERRSCEWSLVAS